MTLETIAWIAVALSWTICLFAGLQLLDRRLPRGPLVLIATLVLGMLVIATRGETFGFAWLRDDARRSDAIALAALLPTLALGLGTMLEPDARTRTWVPISNVVAAFCCAVAGTCALVLGRSIWTWDFAALLVAGAMMAAVGTNAAIRARSMPNVRLVFGTIATFGIFLTVGTGLLLAAWSSLA